MGTVPFVRDLFNSISKENGDRLLFLSTICSSILAKRDSWGSLRRGIKSESIVPFLIEKIDLFALALTESTIKIYLYPTWEAEQLISSTLPHEYALLINGRRGGDRTLDFFRVKEALSH